MTNAETPLQTVTLKVEQAVAFHQAGKLQEAGRLYREILQEHPNHPDANYNLGILEVQMKQPENGLSHFMAALDADPTCGQYWLSYIDALFQLGQLAAAREVMAMAKKNGLNGEDVAEMEARLENGAVTGNHSNKLPPVGSDQSLAVLAEVSYDKKNVRSNTRKPNKAVKGKIKPNDRNPSPEAIQTLVALFNNGRYAEAANLARSMTEKFPLYAFGWGTLGVVLQKLGRNQDALLPLQKAASLSPNDAQAHSNLGNTLSDLGRLEEAEVSLRRAIAIKNNSADAHVNLGATLNDLGRLNEAQACYLKALQIDPNLAEAHYNLGNTLKNIWRLDEAEASYWRALQIKPGFVNALCNLGVILQATGRLDEAEACLRRAIQLKPNYIEAYSNLGSTLHDMGRLVEAQDVYKMALQIKPDHAEIQSNLGNTLHDMGRLHEAEASYRRALAIKPDFTQALSNLGNTLQDMGRLDEAIGCFQGALAIDPNYIKARSNLLFILNYKAEYTPMYCLNEARQYGKVVSNKVTEKYTQWSSELQPERLRIGFVSADFRNHPVGYFLENILSQLALTAVELIAYPTIHKSDELTARIKPYFSAWKPLYGKSDEAAARLIHDDRVHILIDLSGHTQHNRLPIFSWKPAPVQVSWLGYFATTGVAEIDYIIGDRYVSPNNETEHFTEKIWQLPDCYWCFSEPNQTIEVTSLPALTSGRITFACFNNLTKMNDSVVAVWARILSAVPGSKLFLKYSQLNDPLIRESTLQRYAKYGITADRLIFEGTSPRAEYLACYHRVDIALDPFPYPGGTTSLESLWMGVPVITKRGDRFLSHAGETIAHNAGLSEWVAVDEEDYVAKAVLFASDMGGLARLRSGLRQQVLKSALFDATRFAGHFEKAMWMMWKHRLEK